jgi:hypothetical protein
MDPDEEGKEPREGSDDENREGNENANPELYCNLEHRMVLMHELPETVALNCEDPDF